MFCVKCGAVNQTGAKFCAECGERLEETGTAYANVAQAAPPVPAEIKANGEKKTKNTNLSVLSVILTVFLCLLLFVFSFAAVLLYTVGASLSEEAVSKAVFAVSADVLEDDYGITGQILQGLDAEIVQKNNIRASNIKKFLERSAVREFVSEKVAGYVVAFRSGDTGQTLKKGDVIRFLQKNEAALQKDLGYLLTEEDYQYIESYMDREGVLDGISVKGLLSGADIDVFWIQAVLSAVTFAVFLILCAGTLTGIILLNRRRIRRVFLSAGIPFALVGLIFTTAAMLMYSIIATAAGSALSGALIREAFAQIRNAALSSGMLMLITGALLISAYALMNLFRPEKRKS